MKPKKTKKIAKINLQQGDVCLKKIDKLPEGERKILKKNHKNEMVLAEGEKTGHSHTIYEEDSNLMTIDNVMYLDLKNTATLTHQEHGEITLDAGIWQVGIVNEYDYYAQMKRKVVD